MARMNLTTTQTHREKRLVVAKGVGWGGEGLKCGISRWINKVCLYSPGNYIQHSVIDHEEKEYEKECHIFITILHCTAEINTTL